MVSSRLVRDGRHQRNGWQGERQLIAGRLIASRGQVLQVALIPAVAAPKYEPAPALQPIADKRPQHR